MLSVCCGRGLVEGETTDLYNRFANILQQYFLLTNLLEIKQPLLLVTMQYESIVRQFWQMHSFSFKKLDCTQLYLTRVADDPDFRLGR